MLTTRKAKNVRSRLGITRSNSNQIGATIVEFAIVFSLILMIIAGIIDMGITFFRYNLLAYASQRITRQIAVKVGTSINAGDLQQAAKANLESFMQNVGAAQSADMTVSTPDIDVTGCGTPYKKCYLHFTDVRWNMFSAMAWFMSGNTYVRTEAKVLIEDPCFDCTSVPCTPGGP